MTAIGDTSLNALEVCGKNHVPVDRSLCLILPAFVAGYTFVQSTK